jgi:hypothetical protein
MNMPGGVIDPEGRLGPGRPDPTRDMTPRGPDYAKDAERFKDKLKKRHEDAEREAEEERIRTHGRGQTQFVIKGMDFILPYSKYKGKSLAYVSKHDKKFAQNFADSGEFTFSAAVKKILRKRGIAVK